MNLFSHIHHLVTSAVEGLITSGKLPQVSAEVIAKITCEPPKEAKFGDMSTNAAMVLAKPCAMNPRAIAEIIISELSKCSEVASAEIAGAGFINLTLPTSKWHELVRSIDKLGLAYGSSQLGAGEPVNVEYVSANPTGPMHIGHARCAAVGATLAEIMRKAGFDVTREFYINDAGSQIITLARSAYLRYLEAAGQEIGEIPAGLYPGDYLVPVGQYLHSKFGDSLISKPEEEYLPLIKKIAVAQMLELVKGDLGQLGVEFDVFTSEQETVHDHGLIEKAISKLSGLGLLYEGVLAPPKGEKAKDWQERPQLLFRSTDFGDDEDRALTKSDGSYTYFAADLGYLLHKLSRGFKRLVLVLGADHIGYGKRMQAATKALSDGQATLEIIYCQLVSLTKAGQPVKMSKRAGTFVTVSELYEQVGRAPIRFSMLDRKHDMMMEFDIEGVKELSKDNPVFYVQYAYARCHSIKRMIATQLPEAIEYRKKEGNSLIELISTEDELMLIKMMARWPRVIEASAIAGEPHRVVYYLQELAGYFHALWNKGREENDLRFVQFDDAKLTAARLVLVEAVATVIASGLVLFNITPQEAM